MWRFGGVMRRVVLLLVSALILVGLPQSAAWAWDRSADTACRRLDDLEFAAPYSKKERKALTAVVRYLKRSNAVSAPVQARLLTKAKTDRARERAVTNAVEWCVRWAPPPATAATTPPTTTPPPPPTPPPNPPSISLDEFNQISSGMSYDEVVAIIGGPGTLTSQTDIAGYHGEIWSFTGTGGIGANAIMQFQNGALISKAQFGLR